MILQPNYPEENNTLISRESSLINTNGEIQSKELLSENSPVHISYQVPDAIHKAICHKDDRVLISGKIYPYNMICRIVINDNDNKRQYFGTGFLIAPKVVITCGHCLHLESGWAKSVIVMPGANGADDQRPYGAQLSTSLHGLTFFTKKRDENYDYGAIILPDDSLYKKVGNFFAYESYADQVELINSGYPRDKKYEQWTCSGRISSSTLHKLIYGIDTKKGNSGSPVFIKKNDKYVVVGIHRAGDCPNECIKVNSDVISTWKKWVDKSNM